MPKENKSNDATLKLRVLEIQKLLMRGYSRPDIIDYVRDNTDWNIGEGQIRNYIKKAMVQFDEDVAETFEYERAQAVNRLTRLYRECLQNRRYKDALQTQQELNKLLGLYNNDGTATGDVNTGSMIQVEFTGIADEED